MIIHSLLDTDLYKFTMMQLVLHRYPSVMAELQFKCRTPNIDLRPFVKEIENEIAELCKLRFQAEELTYLSKIGFFKEDFIDFLRIFQLNQAFIEISVGEEMQLVIKGPWLHIIMFEVPVLAIISELYSRACKPAADFEMGKKRLREKIELVKANTPPNELKIIEFGTRRRYSFAWQKQIISILQQEIPGNLVGTSNVYYAKEFGLNPIGTMAHEYIQAFQVLAPNLIESQRYALEVWAQEYRGELGIALSDTYNIDVFLRDFDLYLCKLYEGVRQDSGNPVEWTEKLLQHYEKLHIDPLTKTIVFSDSLTFPLAIDLFRRYKARVNTVFGIGTNLTNDLGPKAIQIVIKMTGCNGQPVAKLSDTPAKTLCNDKLYLTYLKHVLGIQ